LDHYDARPEDLAVADLDQLAEQLSQLTVRQFIQLAQRVVARALDADATPDPGALASVVLHSPGQSKFEVIRVLRELTDLGLAEARGVVDHAPSVIVTGIPLAEARAMVQKLIEAGATAEVDG
jgi:large subunit ribosomal protein L7/L12